MAQLVDRKVQIAGAGIDHTVGPAAMKVSVPIGAFNEIPSQTCSGRSSRAPSGSLLLRLQALLDVTLLSQGIGDIAELERGIAVLQCLVE